MKPSDFVRLILEIYKEAESAGLETMVDRYGQEKSEELLRDFFKGVETWMRKHDITKFEEMFTLVAIMNTRLYISIHNNLAKSLSEVAEMKHV